MLYTSTPPVDVQTAEPKLRDTSIVSQSVTNNRCAPHVGAQEKSGGTSKNFRLANCFRRHCPCKISAVYTRLQKVLISPKVYPDPVGVTEGVAKIKVGL